MLSVPVSLLIVLVAQSTDGAFAAPPASPPTEVTLSVASGTAPVLPGLAVGVTAEVRRRLYRTHLPLFVAARLQWTEASGANENWMIDHHQFVAAAATGLAGDFGPGRLWAEAGVGAAGVYEVLTRQGSERLMMDGFPTGNSTTFTVGPYAFGEVGAGLVLRGRVRAIVAGGPTVALTNVGGSGTWSVGGLGRLGVAYDF
jgi:hypothetical protein